MFCSRHGCWDGPRSKLQRFPAKLSPSSPLLRKISPMPPSHASLDFARHSNPKRPSPPNAGPRKTQYEEPRIFRLNIQLHPQPARLQKRDRQRPLDRQNSREASKSPTNPRHTKRRINFRLQQLIEAGNATEIGIELPVGRLCQQKATEHTIPSGKGLSTFAQLQLRCSRDLTSGCLSLRGSMQGGD